MGWGNPFKEVANSKPLFLAIYATVIFGILVSSFYVLSAVFSSSGSFSSVTLSTSAASGTCKYMYSYMFLSVFRSFLILMYQI